MNKKYRSALKAVGVIKNNKKKYLWDLQMI